jgi:hypothetical protein
LRKVKEKGEKKMNYKRLFAILMITAMLGMIMPTFAGLDPHCVNTPNFVVLIDGQLSVDGLGEPLAVTFTEPTYGYCKTFTVEAWVYGVTDLYAFDFSLVWNATPYASLRSWTVEAVWPNQYNVLPDIAYETAFGEDGDPGYIEIAASALPPSTGVSGDVKLATLTFHIDNDICYCDGFVMMAFDFDIMKLSDSCSQEINYCNPYNGLVEFDAVAPKIYIVGPGGGPIEINSVINTKFTKEIWVKDVVKFNSLHFILNWTKNNADAAEYPSLPPRYVDTLKLEYIDWNPIFANAPAFPGFTSATLQSNSDNWGLIVDINLKPGAYQLNGTIWIATLTFLKLDPWYCGSQPDYTFRQPHEWTAANATVMFSFMKGKFDGCCADDIYFGEVFGTPLGKPFKEVCGTSTWWYCEAVKYGGGAINETVYTGTDYAAVSVPISLPAHNTSKLGFYYYSDGYTTAATPRMAVTFNWTGNHINYIAISSPAPAVYNLWTLFDAENYGWTWGTWNGKDLSTFVGATFFANWGALVTDIDASLGTNVKITSAIAYLRGADTPAEPNGVYIDEFELVTNMPDAVPDVTNKYDLEPCSTSYWYDRGLYAACYPKIANLYIFRPIPGDLNRDGVVDITDIIIMARHYVGAAPYSSFYDFNGDNVVDIFDFVVITKNFGRTTP